MLRNRHREGTRIAQDYPAAEGQSAGGILPARAKYAPKGARAFARLATESGVPLAELYARRRFAIAYDQDSLNRLCGRRRAADGLPLSWRLVKWLARVPDPRLREELERRAAEGGWAVEDLRAATATLLGGPRGGGGRPVRPPKSVESGLAEAAGQAAGLVRLLRSIPPDPAPADAGGGHDEMVRLLDHVERTFAELMAEIGVGIAKARAAREQAARSRRPGQAETGRGRATRRGR